MNDYSKKIDVYQYQDWVTTTAVNPLGPDNESVRQSELSYVAIMGRILSVRDSVEKVGSESSGVAALFGLVFFIQKAL